MCMQQKAPRVPCPLPTPPPLGTLSHLLRLRPLLWLRSRIRASAADVSMPMLPRDLRISVVFNRPRVLCFRGMIDLQQQQQQQQQQQYSLAQQIMNGWLTA
jgi:hypothetical protein